MEITQLHTHLRYLIVFHTGIDTCKYKVEDFNYKLQLHKMYMIITYMLKEKMINDNPPSGHF